VPYGTDSRWNLFQAINCLATIIQSLLRDKVALFERPDDLRQSDSPLRDKTVQYFAGKMGPEQSQRKELGFRSDWKPRVTRLLPRPGIN